MFVEITGENEMNTRNKVLKKAIKTETFNVDFHNNKFSKFGLLLFKKNFFHTVGFNFLINFHLSIYPDI